MSENWTPDGKKRCSNRPRDFARKGSRFESPSSRDKAIASTPWPEMGRRGSSINSKGPARGVPSDVRLFALEEILQQLAARIHQVIDLRLHQGRPSDGCDASRDSLRRYPFP